MTSNAHFIQLSVGSQFLANCKLFEIVELKIKLHTWLACTLLKYYC